MRTKTVLFWCRQGPKKDTAETNLRVVRVCVCVHASMGVCFELDCGCWFGCVCVCVCFDVCINDLARNRRITGECMADFTCTL